MRIVEGQVGEERVTVEEEIAMQSAGPAQSGHLARPDVQAVVLLPVQA